MGVAALREGKEAGIVAHAGHSQNMWSGVSRGQLGSVAGGREAGAVASVCCPDCSREDRANCFTEGGAAEVVGPGRVGGLQVEGQRFDFISV